MEGLGSTMKATTLGLLLLLTATNVLSARRVIYRAVPNEEPAPVFVLRDASGGGRAELLDSASNFQQALNLFSSSPPSKSAVSGEQARWGLFNKNEDIVIHKPVKQETIVHHHYIPYPTSGRPHYPPYPARPSYPPVYGGMYPPYPFPTYPPYQPQAYPAHPHPYPGHGGYPGGWNEHYGHSHHGPGDVSYPPHRDDDDDDDDDERYVRRPRYIDDSDSSDDTEM